MRIVGIDPGNKGMIACIGKKEKIYWIKPTPLKLTPRKGKTKKGKKKRDKQSICAKGVWELLSSLKEHRVSLIVIEAVQHMPRDGGAGSFSFGKSFGTWLGVLAVIEDLYGIPHQVVSPLAWKKQMGTQVKGKKGQSAKEKKRDKEGKKQASIKKAKELFPKVNLKRSPRCIKEDDNIAEALLLAAWGREFLKGGNL